MTLHETVAKGIEIDAAEKARNNRLLAKMPKGELFFKGMSVISEKGYIVEGDPNPFGLKGEDLKKWQLHDYEDSVRRMEDVASFFEDPEMVKTAAKIGLFDIDLLKVLEANTPKILKEKAYAVAYETQKKPEENKIKMTRIKQMNQKRKMMME